MMPNSYENSVKNSVALMDGRNGGKLRRGNPGNRGRPTEAFAEHLRDILEQPDVHAAFMAIITDPSHSQFTSLFKAAAAYAYGRPPQTVKLEKDIDADKPMTPERRSEVLEQMRRLVRIEDKEKLLAAPKQIAARSD